MTGALSKKIGALRLGLIDLRAHLEACIDFPDDDVDILAHDRAADILQFHCDQIKTFLLLHIQRAFVGLSESFSSLMTRKRQTFVLQPACLSSTK